MIETLDLFVQRDTGALNTRLPIKPISFQQGESVELNTTLRYSDAVDWSPELAGGTVIAAILTLNGKKTIVAHQLDVIDEDQGALTLKFEPGDSVNVKPSQYVWGVWYESAGGQRYPLVGLSPCTIGLAAVKPTTLVTPLPAQVPLAKGDKGDPGADGDILPTDAEEGDVLTWNGTEWVPAVPTGGGTDLPDATDDDVGEPVLVSQASPLILRYGHRTPHGEPGKKKRLCFSRLTHPSGADTAATADVYGVAFDLPPDVTRIRIYDAMYDILMFNPSNYVNGADVPNMKLAYGWANALGTDFDSAPTQITGITLKAGGCPYLSGWLDIDDPPAPGRKFMITWTQPNGTIFRNFVNAWGFRKASSSDVSTLSGAVATEGAAGTIGIWVETRYKPITCLNNSQMTGLIAPPGSPSEVGFGNTFGRDLIAQGYWVSKNGVSASTIADWEAQVRWMLRNGWLWIRGHDVLLCDPVNDWNNGTFVVDVWPKILSFAQQVSAMGGIPWVCTAPGTSLLSAPDQTQRRYGNRLSRGNFPRVFDIDAILNPGDLDATPGLSNDNIHYSAAQHRALEAAVANYDFGSATW